MREFGAVAPTKRHLLIDLIRFNLAEQSFLLFCVLLLWILQIV